MILLSVELRGTTATARVCEVRAWPTRKSRLRDCRLVTSGHALVPASDLLMETARYQAGGSVRD